MGVIITDILDLEIKGFSINFLVITGFICIFYNGNEMMTWNRSLLFKAVSLTAIFVLLTGQSLNCCRINEDIAAALKELLPHSHEAKVASSEQASHCHGSAHDHDAEGDKIVKPTPFSFIQPSESIIHEQEDCLSDQKADSEKMVASIPGIHVAPMDFVTALNPDLDDIVSNGIRRPRPQNKSSPPLYLTTLHILV